MARAILITILVLIGSKCLAQSTIPVDPHENRIRQIELQLAQDDLKAQEQMAEFTRKIYCVTAVQAIFSVLGFGVLMYTLKGTQEATKIAREAYRAEHRPWVYPVIKDVQIRGAGGWTFNFVVGLEKFSETPPTEVELVMWMEIRPASNDVIELKDAIESCASDKTHTHLSFFDSTNYAIRVQAPRSDPPLLGEESLFLFGYVKYKSPYDLEADHLVSFVRKIGWTQQGGINLDWKRVNDLHLMTVANIPYCT